MSVLDDFFNYKLLLSTDNFFNVKISIVLKKNLYTISSSNGDKYSPKNDHQAFFDLSDSYNIVIFSLH